MVGGRHGHTAHQHRDDAGASLEGGRDFQGDEVLRIVDATVAGAVADAGPSGPDDGKQHIACGETLFENTRKGFAWGDVLGVQKNALGAELALQPVAQPAGIRAGVVAPVADENRGHALPPPRRPRRSYCRQRAGSRAPG